jgi:hypothetical protein
MEPRRRERKSLHWNDAAEIGPAILGENLDHVTRQPAAQRILHLPIRSDLSARLSDDDG